jgi:hypothetical protein
MRDFVLNSLLKVPAIVNILPQKRIRATEDKDRETRAYIFSLPSMMIVVDLQVAGIFLNLAIFSTIHVCFT